MKKILIIFGIFLLLRLSVSATENPARMIKGHLNSVTSIAFSPNGKYAFSGSSNKNLILWNVATGKKIRTFFGHSGGITSVAFAPNGKYALSGASDKTLILWNIATGKKVRTFFGHSDGVTSVAFSPNGKSALSGSWKTIILWNVSTGNRIRTFTGHSDYVTSVAFSRNGKYALSGSDDCTLKLWNIAPGKKIRTFTGHSEAVLSVAFSPNGKYALSGSRDKTMILWNVPTGKRIRTFTDYSNSVLSVAFSPDGKYALSAGDKTLILWDIGTGKKINTFLRHSYLVSSVMFSRNGKFVLSGDINADLKLWDISKSNRDKTLDSTVAVAANEQLEIIGGIPDELKEEHQIGILSKQKTTGYFLNSKWGDYRHLNIKDLNGKTQSFFIATKFNMETLTKLESDPETAKNQIELTWYKAKKYMPETGGYQVINVATEIKIISPKDPSKLCYIGSINQNLKIHMVLQFQNDQVTGHYYYDRYQTNISLKGVIENEHIILNEYDPKGNVTGVFRGSMSFRNKIRGTWSKPNSDKTLDFEVAIDNDSYIKITKWEGEWQDIRGGERYGLSLIISDVTDKGFEFQILYGDSGGTTGGIPGEARFIDNYALWIDKPNHCQVKFTMVNNHIIVVTSGDIGRYGGIDVTFDGEFVRE